MGCLWCRPKHFVKCCPIKINQKLHCTKYQKDHLVKGLLTPWAAWQDGFSRLLGAWLQITRLVGTSEYLYILHIPDFLYFPEYRNRAAKNLGRWVRLLGAWLQTSRGCGLQQWEGSSGSLTVVLCSWSWIQWGRPNPAQRRQANHPKHQNIHTTRHTDSIRINAITDVTTKHHIYTNSTTTTSAASWPSVLTLLAMASQNIKHHQNTNTSPENSKNTKTIKTNQNGS